MLLGLVGNSRAGKDTVAGILVQDYGFEQRNLAQPIRETLLAMGLYVLEDGEEITLSYVVTKYGWDFTKAHYPETVDWMIGLGQSMRNIDPDIWLNACVSGSYDNLVIADVRQPNEYDYIKDNGGKVWRINRPDAQKLGMDGLLDDRLFDAEIFNVGSVEYLRKLVGYAMHLGPASLRPTL